MLLSLFSKIGKWIDDRVFVLVFAFFLLSAIVWPWHNLFSDTPDFTFDNAIFVLVFDGLFIVVGAYYLQLRQIRSLLRAVVFEIILLSLTVSLILTYAAIYRSLGLLLHGDDPINDPATCLYFSIITWTTLGYGDITPSHPARFWAASEAIVGYVMMALLIGTFTVLFRIAAGNDDK